MVSDRKIKAFTEFIERAYKKHVAEIEKAFPEKKIDYKVIIGSGRGKIRSSEEIRRTVKENSWTSLTDAFDLSDEIAKIEKQNNICKAKREGMINKLSEEKHELLKTVYFANEEELLKKLNEFEQKKLV